MKSELEIGDGGVPERPLVTVSAKRLDSDEVEETIHEVSSLPSDAVIRERLAAIVSSLYPEAEFRSYSSPAATFLAPKLLIVAVYRPGEDSNAQGEEDEDTQQQLFAA